jgi:hypothetical protein
MLRILTETLASESVACMALHGVRAVVGAAKRLLRTYTAHTHTHTPDMDAKSGGVCGYQEEMVQACTLACVVVSGALVKRRMQVLDDCAGECVYGVVCFICIVGVGHVMWIVWLCDFTS